MILSITDMTCSGCARSITRAIRMNDPQATVSADIEARQVSVETALPEEDVLRMLKNAGFEARSLAR